MSDLDNADRNSFRQPEEAKSYEGVEKFSQYFPTAKIFELNAGKVPPEAMRYFEEQSREYSQPAEDSSPADFEKFLLVSHSDTESTVVAMQTKIVGATQDEERIAYFVDMSEGKKVGHGIMRNNISSPDAFLAGKPFSEFIFANENQRGQGRGRRLLKMMNATSQAEYGLPLYSGMDMKDQGRIAWQKLADAGEARMFKEGTYDRYVMEFPFERTGAI